MIRQNFANPSQGIVGNIVEDEDGILIGVALNLEVDLKNMNPNERQDTINEALNNAAARMFDAGSWFENAKESSDG